MTVEHDDLAIPAAGSVIDALRAKRDQLAADRTVRLPAPGLPGVELELAPLDEGARRRFAARAERRGADQETTTLIGLYEACRAVYVNGENAGPIGDLAESILGRDPGSPRDAVLALWCDPMDADAVDRAVGLIGPLMLRYNEWLSAAGGDEDETILGK